MQGFNEKGWYYARSGVSLDHTHGGHEEQHKREIEAIANDIFDKRAAKLIQAVQEEAYNNAVSALLDALKIDINSIVTVGFENGKNIFYGKECQTAIMEAIYNEVKKHLNSNLL